MDTEVPRYPERWGKLMSQHARAEACGKRHLFCTIQVTTINTLSDADMEICLVDQLRRLHDRSYRDWNLRVSPGKNAKTLYLTPTTAATRKRRPQAGEETPVAP